MTRTLVALLAALAAGVAHADAVRADHPLLGNWIITLPDGSCHETYRFRADGTSIVTSAEEVGESRFVVSDRPSEKGFYRWVDKVVKDNGKKDCSGEVTAVGDSATKYLRFNPPRDRFLMCDAEDLRSCIGPFVRMKGEDT